jgi:hypothetical protein
VKSADNKWLSAGGAEGCSRASQRDRGMGGREVLVVVAVVVVGEEFAVIVIKLAYIARKGCLNTAKCPLVNKLLSRKQKRRWWPKGKGRLILGEEEDEEEDTEDVKDTEFLCWIVEGTSCSIGFWRGMGLLVAMTMGGGGSSDDEGDDDDDDDDDGGDEDDDDYNDESGKGDNGEEGGGENSRSRMKYFVFNLMEKKREDIERERRGERGGESGRERGRERWRDRWITTFSPSSSSRAVNSLPPSVRET